MRPRGRAAPSTPPSATPSPHWATTPTWPRSGRRPRRRRQRARSGGGVPSRAAQSALTARSASRGASVSTSVRPPRRWRPIGPPPASPAGSARGALVSLGGDVAVAGPPPAGGWADRHRPGVVDPGRARSTRWWPSGRAAWPAPPRRSGRGGRVTVSVHHIVDPRTGDCVEPYWVLVSATGSSCVEAEPGDDRRHRVGRARPPTSSQRFGQPVRLVRSDGEVFCLNGWPQEAAA